VAIASVSTAQRQLVCCSVNLSQHDYALGT
jgi:hypothetical protein